ncbi:MAG: sigma-54-dependent transcriptional regulator [Myxococcota bacterium]
MGRILVVDDEAGIRDAIELLADSLGHRAVLASDVQTALGHLEKDNFDLVITDLRLASGDEGMTVVERARRLDPAPEVILMTAYGTREKAQTAISLGATFYLEKSPHLAGDLRVLIRQAITKRQLVEENDRLRRELIQASTVGGLLGKSSAMKEVIDIIERVAPVKVTTLICGESGTGKERVARALHLASGQRDGPFVPVNCGAVPEALIESELFGHAKGAFTGADQEKLGLFEAASGGTIFLDEIGELPLALQPKLLRVLQERKVKKVGALDETEVDVRVIAASNRDLETEADKGRFREDLYFRLNVVRIDLPALRQRTDDIPLLAQHFVRKYAREYDRPVQGVDPEAMKRILDYTFPGNVRELENAIERGVALARGSSITVEQLPKELRLSDSRPSRAVQVSGDGPAFPEEGIDLERVLHDFEFSLIRKALDRAGGVKTRAAELLGLTFRQFRYKLKKFEDS